MRIRPLALSLALLAGVGTAAAVASRIGSFLSAPAGVPVSTTAVALPAVKWAPNQPLPPRKIGGLFGPTVEELLTQNFIFTEELEMKRVWAALFTAPYDASQFDFQNDAVIWMGGNSMQLGSFDISQVERVDANYASLNFPLPGSDVNPFLAVTALRVFPGAFPQDPPPDTYRVSAVRIAKTDLDDAVFHVSNVFLP